MREPLDPMTAYRTDVRDGERWTGHPTQPHGWFSLTHIAYRVASLPPDARLQFLRTLPTEILPEASRRPTHVDLGSARTTNPFARAAEQFRVAAEDMERDLCFEMAYTTVTAAARIVARHDPSGSLSATNHLARILRQLGETTASESLYQSVVDDAMQRGYPSVAGYAYTGLGNLAIMRGNRPAQLRYFSEALTLSPADSVLEAASRHGLMNHALTVNSLSDALVHGWRAYDLTESHEERAGILHNLASVAFRARFVDEALAGLQSALTMARTSRVWLAIAASAAEAAGVRCRTDFLLKLENDGQRHGSTSIPFEHGQWLLGLAKGWAAAGAHEASDRFAHEALGLAQRHEFHELAYRAEQVLHQNTVEAGDVGGCRESFESTEALTESTRSGLARLCTVGA